MPTRITKVSDSNFFTEDIKKFSRDLIEAPNEGMNIEETIKELINKSKENKKKNPSGPLLNNNDAKLLSDAHYEKTYYYLKDEKGLDEKSARYRAESKRREVYFQYTAVMQDKYDLDNVAGELLNFSSKLALGFPVYGKIVAGFEMSASLSKLYTSMLGGIKEFSEKNKDSPEIIATGVANPLGFVTKKILNDEQFLNKYYKEMFTMDIIVGEILNVIINGLSIVIPGPGGVSAKIALNSAKGAFQSAMLGNISGLLNLIKTILSGDLSSKIPNILAQILSLVREPLRQLLSEKVKEPKENSAV